MADFSSQLCAARAHRLGSDRSVAGTGIGLRIGASILLPGPSSKRRVMATLSAAPSALWRFDIQPPPVGASNWKGTAMRRRSDSTTSVARQSMRPVTQTGMVVSPT